MARRPNHVWGMDWCGPGRNRENPVSDQFVCCASILIGKARNHRDEVFRATAIRFAAVLLSYPDGNL